jgi:hypothetical protein
MNSTLVWSQLSNRHRMSRSSNPNVTISYYYCYLNCRWVFARWQWYYSKTQHTNNAHHTQTKHSTQTTKAMTGALHTMNTMQVLLQLQQIQLKLQLNKLILIKMYYTLNSNSNWIRNAMIWCTHISPWPSLLSTSLHLRSLHIFSIDFTLPHLSLS